jgi:2'-5' RNA ligase
MKNIYIVILPDLNTKKYLESLRSKLVTKYDLILPKHPLHITLRSTFKVKNYNFLIKDLEVYPKGKQPFYLTTKKISFFAGNTVVAEIRNKKMVKDLAKDIVKIAQKYKVNEEIKQKNQDL